VILRDASWDSHTSQEAVKHVVQIACLVTWRDHGVATVVSAILDLLTTRSMVDRAQSSSDQTLVQNGF